MTRLPRISPCLWFETNAEEAVNFYLSAFQSGRIVDTVRYGAGGRMPKGTVLTISFELNGHPLMALNGGPHEKFNDAISLQVVCDTQEDIDTLWQRLTAGGGKPVQCGWLKDKYGVSWQIVPAQLQDMMQAADAEKAARVMAAVMKMVKLDIEQLQAAYDG